LVSGSGRPELAHVCGSPVPAGFNRNCQRASCFAARNPPELAVLAALRFVTTGCRKSVSSCQDRSMKGPIIKMSGDADDKLAACFARPSTDPTEQRYFDACARWWSTLTPQNRDVVRTIIDAVASAHKDAAESMAAALPPAPRCPL
jgi:hypothetical protein